MLALPDLQHRFWKALSSAPGELSADEGLLSYVEPSRHLTSTQRLQIYADAYFWRLHGVLKENYARVAARLDDTEFTRLVGEYLRAYPSRHPSISYVGAQFAEQLAASHLDPWLVDLAKLEWLHAIVFESADATPIDADTLRPVPPESWSALRFTPLPGLTTISLDYPVHRLWSDSMATIDAAEPTRLRLWRNREFVVMHSVLDEREDRALARLQEGACFAEICEAFADLPDEQAAQESIGLLVRWLTDGILAGFHL